MTNIVQTAATTSFSVDWTVVLTALVAIIPAAIIGVLNYLQQRAVKTDIATVKEQTNHIKDALVASTKIASHAEGVQDEKIRVADEMNVPIKTVVAGTPIKEKV